MTEILSGIFVSFVLTFLMLPILIRYASTRDIFVPRQFRSVHQSKVSALGGVAIFSGVFFSLIFFTDFESFATIRYYMAAGSFMFVLGLRDDIYNTSPTFKMLGQVIGSVIMVVLGDLRIRSFDFYTFHISFPYFWSIIISVLLIIWIVNAYNFFDGIDFQASVVAIILLIPIGMWFYFAHQDNFSLLLLATAAALFAFIIFNYSPAKIFMGDTGTMTIGFIIAVSLLKFENLNSLIEIDNINFPNAILMSLGALSLPLLDSVRVVLARIFRGKSPIAADKNHWHHLLLRLGFSQNRIAFWSGFYTLWLLASNYYFLGILNAQWFIGIDILLYILSYQLVIQRIKWQSR